MEKKTKVLRCSSSTDANKLSGSIYSVFQESSETEIVIRVIGAGALNQAIKAVIISNKFFAKKGYYLAVKPSFQDTVDSMTAIELKIIFLS